MSVKKAVVEVLKKAQSPLHARAITEQIIASGLWHSAGKTPEASVSARLYSDIKRNGSNSPFIKVANQTFALREPIDATGVATETGSTPLKADKKTSPPLEKMGLSFTTCAEKVLAQFGKKKPMHYRDITKKAIAEGWLLSSGKTPAASMYAQLITEIKRQQKDGKLPRFVQHGRGYVGLSQWMRQGLGFQIEQHNDQIRKKLHERLIAMTPSEFEELVSVLLTSMGFEMIEVTNLCGDGGIDVRGVLVVGDVVRIKMAVQAKKWKLKNNIQAPIVQQVRGSLGAHEQGLIITTSDFSSGAIKEASQSDKTPIALMNGEQLVTLLMEHGIGVRRIPSDLFEIDDEEQTTDSL